MGASIGSASVSGIGGTAVCHCNYRNLNDTQVAVSDRTPLLIDGLESGSFSTFGPSYEIWNPATSRITPKNSTQVFDGRITLEVLPTVGNSLFTIELDRSPDNSEDADLVYSKRISLPTLQWITITESFTFFASQTFLENGGKIWISCSDSVAIANAALYLFLKGGRP